MYSMHEIFSTTNPDINCTPYLPYRPLEISCECTLVLPPCTMRDYDSSPLTRICTSFANVI